MYHKTTTILKNPQKHHYASQRYHAISSHLAGIPGTRLVFSLQTSLRRNAADIGGERDKEHVIAFFYDVLGAENFSKTCRRSPSSGRDSWSSSTKDTTLSVDDLGQRVGELGICLRNHSGHN